MNTPKQVAEFFLKMSQPEVGDTITNLKLQKLVYYAQGFHLAFFDELLFDESILAWEHGPVIESLYHTYKVYGSGSIPQPKDFKVSVFSKKQVKLLKEVNEIYGQFSAWKLRNMTHSSDSPWSKTEKNDIINTDLMKEFFIKQLV